MTQKQKKKKKWIDQTSYKGLTYKEYLKKLKEQAQDKRNG